MPQRMKYLTIIQFDNGQQFTLVIPIFTLLLSYLAYTTLKTYAECWPHSTYVLTQKTSVKTLEECAHTSRNVGVNLFVSCQNSRFFCYIYTKTQSSTTCATKHYSVNCNVYKVSGAASSTVGKGSFNSYVTLNFIIFQHLPTT